MIFSCVELPYEQEPQAPIWTRLNVLNSDYEGVCSFESSTTARLMWQHRLLLAQDNVQRLLELTCAQGFYVSIDDYTLPGKYKNKCLYQCFIIKVA
jgi:hypothetical protein